MDKIPILTQEEADRRIYEALYPKIKKLDIKNKIKEMGANNPIIPMGQPVAQNQPQKQTIPSKPISKVNNATIR